MFSLPVLKNTMKLFFEIDYKEQQDYKILGGFKFNLISLKCHRL